MAAIHYLAFVLFPVGMAFAATSDLLTMTISNRVTLGLAAAFFLLAPFAGMDWSLFGLHVAAGAIVLAIAFGCFAFGWIGGGDAKLAAVIALWLGPYQTMPFILTASIFGGVLTLAILTFRRQQWPAFIDQAWVQRLHDSKSGVPYGVALAAAALTIYPHTHWVELALG
jgi:prepilin peptidase CpaA